MKHAGVEKQIWERGASPAELRRIEAMSHEIEEIDAAREKLLKQRRKKSEARLSEINRISARQGYREKKSSND